jgi:hypothetical protein
MNKLFSLITGGFTTIADAYVQPRSYVHPSRAGFQKDQAKLRGDVQRVGQGMKTVIAAQNGKQSNKR